MVQELKKKIEEKNRFLKSARKLSGAKDDIINLFEKGIKETYLEQKKKNQKKNSRKIRRKKVRKNKR